MLWERCWDFQKTEHKEKRHNQYHLKALSEALSARRQRGIATEPTQATGETRDERLRGFRSMWRGKIKALGREKEWQRTEIWVKERKKGLEFFIQIRWRWLRGGESVISPFSLQSRDISMLPSRLFTAIYVKSSIHLSLGVRLSGAQDITSAQYAGGVYGLLWLRWDRNHLALYHRAVKSLKVLLDTLTGYARNYILR